MLIRLADYLTRGLKDAETTGVKANDTRDAGLSAIRKCRISHPNAWYPPGLSVSADAISDNNIYHWWADVISHLRTHKFVESEVRRHRLKSNWIAGQMDQRKRICPFWSYLYLTCSTHDPLAFSGRKNGLIYYFLYFYDPSFGSLAGKRDFFVGILFPVVAIIHACMIITHIYCILEGGNSHCTCRGSLSRRV
jgi:hypothetical protein